jgi:hypothetical protein
LYHFNETNGSFVSDASGNGNDGTVTGSTIIDGRFGKGRSFLNSGDGVVIVKNLLGTINSEFTFEAWIFPTLYGDINNRRVIFDQRDNTNGTPVIELALGTLGEAHGTNVISVILRNDANTLAEYYGSSVIPLNQWVHVALVRNYSNSKLTCYVNGVREINVSLGDFGSQSGFHTFTVGRNGFSNQYDFLQDT